MEILKDQNRKKRQTIRVLFCLLLMAIIQLLLYRQIFADGLLFGDLGDGRFNNCVCESWYRFFSGKTGFNDLQSFYPMTDSLAWSDMLLGFAVPYSILRFLGINMFLANKIVLCLTFPVGMFATFALLYKGLHQSALSSLLGAVFTFCSCTVAALAIHTQMLFICWIPVTSLMLAVFLQNCRPDGSKKKRMWFGSLTMISIGMEFWTAFYVGYIHFLLMAAIIVIWILQAFFTQRGWWKAFWQSVKQIGAEFFLYAACILAWFAPLVRLYLPVLLQFGGRQLEEILVFSPRIWDIFDSSQGAGMLSSLENNLYQTLSNSYSSTSGERGYGISLWVLILFAFAAVYLLIRFFRCVIRKEKFPITSQIGLAAALAGIAWYLVVITNGQTSIWLHLVRFIPGASALRAIGRITAFLILLAGLTIAIAFGDLQKQLRGHRTAQYVLLGVGASMLLIFALTERPIFNQRWSIEQQTEMLASVPEQPSDCTCFFIYFGDETQIPLYQVNMDAWTIALDKGLDTINGYSGQFPTDWGLIDVPERYSDAVIKWVDANQIDTTTLYAYDTTEGVWITYEQFLQLCEPQSH